VFALDDLHYGQIALPRRRDMGPYPDSTRSLLGSLTPYLAACLKARMQLDLGRERARLAAAAFEAIPQPLLLLHLPGRAIALNAAAQHWLSASRCLSLRHGRWVYRDAALRHALHELLEAIPHPLRGHEMPTQLRVCLDGEWQDLQRLPLVTAETEAEAGAPVRMLLIIHRPEAGARQTARRLQATHGLTDAEQAVCALLLLGLDARQIALNRNTGRETARSQIKAIYAKLGVAGHAGLLVLARTLNTSE
jgi:DNA-binding CsgD family transcriptional regulator